MTHTFLIPILTTAAVEPEELMLPMRDGVKLYTKIWKPGDGRYPVILTRAYRAGFGNDQQRFTSAGYVYVGQATRGHDKSEGAEGVDKRFFSDAQDGFDTLTWIAQQEWCDGNIAMYGKSYWAATQWLVAPERHPNLKAIVPQNVNPDLWERGYRDHGALQRIVRKASAVLGVRLRSPHDQRLSFAVSLYRATGDLKAVQRRTRPRLPLSVAKGCFTVVRFAGRWGWGMWML